jgi:threonine dehydratase
MSIDYLEKIRSARVYDVAMKTPLEEAVRLSLALKNRILMKREDQQPVFSFKLRGAYNKMIGLSDEQRARGVVAASAGNHAQGVALAAQKLGIRALILMPTTTPSIKIEAVRSYGAEIELYGDTYDESCQRAFLYADERGMTFIHPYDDPDVIAGQGTVAMELLEQLNEPVDAVFIPVGGGGLIAGMAVYIKSLKPEIKVIGVEPEDAPSMHHALQAGERVTLDQVGIFADGVAVKQVGEEPWRVAKDLVDEVILVSTDEICAAIMDVFDDTRSILEPAGALATAGIKKYVEREKVTGQTLVAINSGANMNFDRLRHIAERAELGEHREALLAVTIPERPGSFRAFCQAIGHRGITEFNYRFSDNTDAHIFAGVQLRAGDAERHELLDSLQQQGYAVLDMTDNEMAKLHIRYMVGGHASQVDHEQLYRFEFPERPGALLKFLTHMAQGWNISLFHYRNHGAAYGRVLVGIQVPPEDMQSFQEFLDEVGYPYWNESDNPVYKMFLG